MLNQIFFKYGLYYPVVFVRGEWVPQYLKKLRTSQFLNSKELKALQLNKLNALLSYAKKNVPYYRDSLSTSQLEYLQELSKIPLIDKEILRNKQQRLTVNRIGRGATRKTTGGSTGAPVTLLKNKDAMAQELAAQWRGFSWAAVEIGDKQARFWGVPHDLKARRRAQLIDFVCNRVRCSAFSFNEKDLEEYFRKLQHVKPKYFYGYVSMLVQFATFVADCKLDPPCTLKCIITTAEVLTHNDKAFLEQVFQCKVYNEYGCGEIGTIAHECECGKLHINDENIIIEIIGEDGDPVQPGQTGEVVVTELNNYAMPLIRYRMADYGVLSLETCACGRGLTVLDKIIGREYDFLINSAGQKFHGEFFLYIIEDIKKAGALLKGVQFVQDSVNKLTINIVPQGKLDPSFKKIIVERIHGGFDSEVKVNINEIDHIEREASGKLRVIKNLLF